MADRSQRSTELRVGIVAVLALILLVGGILWGKAFFGRIDDRTVTFLFDDAGGVTTGTPVSLDGVVVGSVLDISLTNDGPVVRTTISRSVRLFEEASAAIRIRELTGGKVIVLDAGIVGGSEAIEPIRGMNEADLGEIVATAARLADQADPLLRRVDSLLAALILIVDDPALRRNLSASLSSLASSGRRLDGLLADVGPGVRSLVANADLTVRDVREVANRTGAGLRNLINTLDGVGGDTGLLVAELREGVADLDAIAERATRLLDAVENGDGIAPRLLHDTVLANEVVDTIRRLKAIISRLGSIGINVNVELGHE